MLKNESTKLKALSDIAAIDITLEFNDILRNILNITCVAMDAHSSTIMLVDETTKELKMVASHGLPEDYIERVNDAAKKSGVTLSYSPSGIVLKTGEHYLVPDLYKEPKDKPWYELSKNIGFTAMMYAPMKRSSRVIGLLIIYMKDAHDFTEDEINFMNIAASQASSVVQNAKMCNMLRTNITELKDHKQHLEEKIKDAHKVLFESERYLTKIFDSSMDGILVIDEHGKFEFGNNASFKILGWDREELIGNYFMKVIPEEMKNSMLDRWHEIQKGIDKQYDAKIITRDGDIKDLLVSHSESNINGKRKYIEVIKDVSEKIRLEQKLIESEENYHAIFENADDTLYTHDLNGFILTMNKTGLLQLGCTEKEVIGSHISKWLTPDTYKKSEVRLKRVQKGETVEQPFIIEVVTKNGEIKWGEVRTSLIFKGDKVTGIQGVARDITEKKKLEEKLHEYHEELQHSYEELIEADKVKTEFVSNMTHELLTPLTSIKGFAELIEEETMGKINSEQRISLDVIIRNSERLIQLIRELLDSALIDNKKFVLQFRIFSLENIILKTIQDVHPQAKEKQIKIITEIQHGIKIYGDDERLMQVIRNLLVNAIKFTPKNGQITIQSVNDNEHIRISVSDNGIGIPEDKLDTIFDRFFQIDGSISRKYGGVGLGLSICKSIIDRHNGLIWAESEGKGSTFHIVLPKKSGNPQISHIHTDK